jgi:16S rRNA (guanine527-N7)-methyltransferase
MSFDAYLKSQLIQSFSEIISQLNLSLSLEVQNQMIRYLELLTQWNEVFNLTAIRDPEMMLLKHIADSLTVIPALIHYHVSGQCFLDVGSGAGLPGIVLALALPDLHWTLLDSNGKKTRFLIQVKAILSLKNVEVVQSRVETFHPAVCFDGIIARAWTSIVEMLEKTKHLYCSGGRLWALKGLYPREELAMIKQPYEVFSLDVPGLKEQRHLVMVSRNGGQPDLIF